ILGLWGCSTLALPPASSPSELPPSPLSTICRMSVSPKIVWESTVSRTRVLPYDREEDPEPCLRWPSLIVALYWRHLTPFATQLL
ncbi:uncharacterized protein N7500_003503, partial [Penicillium coprophilum]|uniref:uncharacterized protein n=1 Tax=Penicillium coprophilum TaxID=36646 RepID=UPI0023A580D3